MGIRNVSGVLVPYELNTTSVEGTVNITNLQSLYVDGDGPDTYGIQLNSVVNGVTIFGQSDYEFWSQNYVDYTPSSQQLVFGDEVWNFTNFSGVFPTSSVYAFSPNGTWADFPELYQGFGPAITIAYPFTLTLYLNTSTIEDRPALYFNYTVSNDTFRQSSSFDYLIFNSTLGTPTRPAPVPVYQADGYQYDPMGLPNDMEITILGNGGGDIAAFTAADATISLQYWNLTAKAMQEVPSAFNAGSETGETAVGLAVYSSGGPSPIALVREGPSFLAGLWNWSGSAGAEPITLDLRPANAFLFVNLGGSENVSGAQWVPTSVTGTSPTSTTGTTVFYLSTGGRYFLDFMLSDRDPDTFAYTATGPATFGIYLPVDATQGVYTPLFALNSYELPPISSSGAGTSADPYNLIANQRSSLAPQFAQLDDWLYPVFPGLLIADSSAWVDITPPSFEINYPSWVTNATDVTALGPNGTYAHLGLPDTNNLQIEFYNASNISLVNAPGISGWLSAFLTESPEGSLILWGCTNVLVASNEFLDQGNAITLYGGTNNTIWGNTFLNTTVAATNLSSIDDSGAFVTGINESESGDLVYNNYFAVPIPALTPTADPFLCGQYEECSYLTYNDTWNVTEQPASHSSPVNGWDLTGSIIGTWYQGGNYWSNYGTTSNPYGVLPYNDSGFISEKGDYVPLVPFTLYPVTFSEKGLPTGASWSVIEDGVMLSSSATSIGAESPNGTFSLVVSGPSGYVPIHPPSLFSVDGAPARVSLVFAPIETLHVEETGLLPGIEWTASVNGTGTDNTTLSASNDTVAINLQVIPGSYTVTAVAPGYTTLPTEALVTVGAGGASTRFEFTPVPANLTLHVSPATASVWVNDLPVTLTHGNVSVNVPPGLVTVEATAAGFHPYFANFTVASGTSPAINVDLRPIFPGTLVLSVVPSSATVFVGGGAVTLSSGGYTASMMPGLYSIEVAASGYYTYYDNITVASNETTSVPISLNAVPTPSPGALGVSTTGWVVIGVLAALAAIFLLGMVYYARRPRGGAGAVAPPPAQPWQETPPNEPPTSR